MRLGADMTLVFVNYGEAQAVFILAAGLVHRNVLRLKLAHE